MIQAPMVILRLPDYNIGVGRFRIFFFVGAGGGQGLEYCGGAGARRAEFPVGTSRRNDVDAT